MYDICIIGAGVVGTAIARELSKYDLQVCIIEKAEDVGTGASKANSGIVHGGYAAKYGTLKGELCIKGNKMFKELDRQLNFGFRETGALVIAFTEEDKGKLDELYKNGIKVGNDDIEIIYGKRIKEIEPYINDEVCAALYCKSVGVASPYEFAIAMAENAIENGVELFLNNEVIAINKKDGFFQINTDKEEFSSKYVINAAGLYSDKVSAMIGDCKFHVLPRRGQYILLGKDQGHLVKTVVFQVPTEKGKGILVTTTYHGNFMIGPNAEEVDDKDDVSTSMEALEYVVEAARKSIKNFDIRKALTTFSGIRAVPSTSDFIIEESERVKGFINVAGIDSPGFTSSPTIALKVVQILCSSGLPLIEKQDFNPYRRPIIIKKNDDFKGSIDNEEPSKNIICRCEIVTEAEIVDAIHRGIPVKCTDAIKRRTRAGMGFCQGNFCKSRVKAILARENGLLPEEIMERGKSEFRPERVDIKFIRKCNK